MISTHTALFFFHNVLKILLTYRPDRSERKVQIGRPNGHFHLFPSLGVLSHAVELCDYVAVLLNPTLFPALPLSFVMARVALV